MNKNHYKVIFSRVLNQLVVVSELAKAQGKATSENLKGADVKTTSNSTALFASSVACLLKPVHFSLMVALGFVYLAPSVAEANADMAIRADKSAPGNQQPTILQTANGLPQVNIQTPSAAGVSRNQYSQFDVAEKGAILNNARKATSTQMAGWVQGNPNLARGEAKVILNEVNSANPSRLKGYVEVAGKKADVVIANPSGIHCEGCGVINAGRATMTTGKAQMENGELKGYEVKGGKITVSGKGMDNSQSDYTDIIAEKAQIDGGVWSKKGIKVTTGKNKVDRTNDSVVYVGDKNATETDRTSENKANQTSQADQAYAVDVSQLGGMYAERIQLVDNGAGLGVRNAGHIGASAGNVQIDSQGKIVNRGNIQAQQDIQLHTKQSLDNQSEGRLLAQQGRIEVNAKKEIAQSGVVSGKQKVTVKANQLTQTREGEIQGGAVELNVKDKVTNRGLINSRGDVETSAPDLLIQTTHVENVGAGRIYGNRVAIGGKLIENKDELTANNRREDGVIAAREQLTLGAEEIRNQTNHYVATQQGASTLYGERGIVIGGKLDEHYQAQGKAKLLLNQSGTLESPKGNIHLGVEKLKNENLHFHAEIENQSDVPINESYIIPDGYKTADRIEYGLLKWIPFSRAGKLAYRTEGAQPLKEGEEISSERLLPQVNEYQCQDYASQSGCHLKPESVYDAANPAWAYFGIQPPSDMPAGLTDIEFPEEPIEPTLMDKPKRSFRESQESFERRLKDYDNAVAVYQQARADYEKEKASYAARLEAYKNATAPFAKWIEENEKAFNALDEKITAHNQRLLGKTFSNFWITHLNRRVVDESVVKTTLPAQILAGGNIHLDSQDVLNDRSQMIAGGRITATGAVKNEDETGYHVLNEYGTSQWTSSRWRGGFKRYHQRDWGSVNAYNNNVVTPYQMGIAQHKENTDYQQNPSTHPSESDGALSQANQALLPSSSLYRLNPNAEGALIETDPAFTNRNQWLSGDYMFKALRSDPQNVLKRLGDGYYEQRLVRDQINQLTGRMFLTGYQDLESQYKALMDNGITFAKKFNLTPGIALSPAQVAQLTSDIVWFEEKTVTLPSGKTVKVVAPRVYALAQPGDLNGQGALISAEVVDLRANRLTNSGTIAGRNLTLLNTQSLHNEGVIRGDKVGIRIEGNFDNLGGTVEAERALLVDVGGDLNHESLTSTTNIKDTHFERSQTTLARKALFHVKGEDGKLHLSANNLNAQGAEIINDGKGDTVIQAKNDVNLTALSVGYDEKLGTGNHYRNEKAEKAVVSTIKGKGDVTITGKNIRTEGAALESEAKLLAVAENDLVLNGAKESDDLEEFHKTKSGSVAKVTKTSFDKQQSETQRGTQVSGKEVVLAAGHDVKGKGLQAIAENDLLIQAGRDVDIAADTNHFKNIHKETKKTSGVFTSGGGITFGSKSEKHHLESEGWTQSDARSTLGSMNGNIKIQAGNHANVLGTDMITPRTNRIDIEGASVKVEAGKDIINSSERHEYKQAGLTIAVSSPVVSTAQSMMHSIKRSGEVKNEKLKNLHQMKAAYESLELAENIKNVTDTLSNLGKMEEGDISNPSVKVSVSIGASQSKQTSETKTVTHSGSELSGGTVAITSRQGDVDILGSSINAKRAELDVAKNLNVESVQDTYQNRSENKNSGWSVGVFVGANGNSYGLGVEGSAQVGKGHENSDSITQRNSYLNAEETVIKTGQDANFKGAKVNTNRLDADIKGNLTLESRQDSNHYDSKQEQAGAGFSVAIYGSGSSASANYSQNKAKVNYAQVEEQTGFHVGEGGMNVTVGGNTHLAGAVIESEAEQGKNRFKTKSLTHSDIENHSEVEVKSISAGLSTDMAQNAKNAVAAAASALGNKHETASSQTQSAIGANIQIETETPENLTALSRDTQNANQKVKAFDLTEIKEQQEAAQVAGELFSKITGDVAKKFKFEDGSKEKIVMHAIAGALAAKVADGNVATGATAGAASEWLNTYVENYLKEQTQDLNLTPQQKEKLRQAAQQVTALAIGAVAGAATGGSTDSIKQGALASYNAETYNRQLHQNEKERIKLLADGDEEKERRLTIAACALVHCSEQIRRDDPNYAETKMYEDLGNSAEFANERVLLRKQSYMFQDAWGAGAEYPMFNYNKAYQLQDYDDANTQVVTRAGGVAQAAYGAGTAFAGGVSCSGGITCVAGGAAILYGADQATAGLQTAWTGKPTQTMGGGVISDLLGVENATGELIYGIANPRAVTVVGNAAKSETLKIMSGVKEGVYRGAYLYGKSPLGDGYTYLGHGQFRGPNGGVVMATGQYDPISGQMIFGGINKETGLANNRYFITSNVDGKQIPVSKPQSLRLDYGNNSSAIHHICTDKNCLSTNNGGPWTPRFKSFFDNAELSMQDPLNKVVVEGHRGPHPEKYHRIVYDRLSEATQGLTPNTEQYKSALQNTLKELRIEVSTPKTQLNKLVTGGEK